MCPKRSFDAILKTTELKKSRAYGSDKGRATHSPPVECTVRGDYQVPGVMGYTGHKEVQNITENAVLRSADFLQHPPPGYTGFVPLSRSESLFGRSYSVIAAACAKRVHGS